MQAAKKGGTYPTVLSAADDVAVNAFLDGRLGFTGIHDLVERVLSDHQPGPGRELDELLETDTWATRRATEFVKEYS